MLPAVAADGGGGAHALWLHPSNPYQDLKYRRLAGSEWSEEAYLTQISKITEYAIAADDLGAVHLVWRIEPHGPNELAYLRWDGQDGQVWSQPETIASSDGRLAEVALAVDDSGRVHVAWIHVPRTGGRRELHYRCRNAAGWSTELSLNPEHPTAWRPAIGADGEGRIHVVWEDTRQGRRDLYTLHGQGSQWTAEERLTRLPRLASSLDACLAVDARSTVHLAWSDNRNDYHDVFYRRWFPDTGWSHHERVTIDPSDAKSPELAVDRSGNAHLVWCDNRDGNREIYYLQRPPDEPWEPDDPGPTAHLVVRCYPNPFKSTTGIRAFVPAAGDWAVHILDLQGRLVRTYAMHASQAGEQALAWDGRMHDDQSLSRGLYFVRVTGQGRSAATRVVLIGP